MLLYHVNKVIIKKERKCNYMEALHNFLNKQVANFVYYSLNYITIIGMLKERGSSLYMNYSKNYMMKLTNFMMNSQKDYLQSMDILSQI